jgi:putative peptidoglycan lipid II flippase
MSLWRNVFTVGGLTMVSRFLGLVRDMVTAAYLGATPLADAVFVAFRLPNLFRSLFAEGAFSIAFVPKFSEILQQRGREHAILFAEHSFALLSTILVLFVIAGEFLMPYIMRVIAPGFGDDPAQFADVVTFSRITFPYILLMSLVALQGGILNALDKFYAFAASPCLMNVVMIVALFVLTPVLPNAGHAFAWGVIASGFAQYGWMAYAIRAEKIHLRWRWPQLSPELRAMLRAVAPAAIGSGALQINILIGVMIGSFLPDGSISYLYYADRINQFPLGVVGIAVGTVLLPVLSRAIAQNDLPAAIDKQNRGIELSLLLSIPATAALLVIPLPVIEVLFMRGAFDANVAVQTAHALSAFALGLPAYVLIKALSPGFFARGDTKTPVKIAFFCVALNTMLNLFLIGLLGHVGIALGTSIASWVNAIMLALALKSRGHWHIDARLRSRSIRIFSASFALATAVYGMQIMLEPWLADHFGHKLWALIVMVLGGIAVYAVLVLTLRAVDRDDLAQLRRAPRG